MSKEYKNPALTTDIILFSCEAGVKDRNGCDEQAVQDCNLFSCEDEKDLKVLLIKRKYEPFKDKWAFPGGFVEYDEELEAAAHRELEEETNIKDICLEQLGTFGRVGRDPRGRTISVVYYVFVDNSLKLNIKAQDDAKEVQWFSVKKLPELAFDHSEIMDFALEKLEIKF